jgi:hypothetical protein
VLHTPGCECVVAGDEGILYGHEGAAHSRRLVDQRVFLEPVIKVWLATTKELRGVFTAEGTWPLHKNYASK